MLFNADPIYLAGPMTGRPGLNHDAFHAAARWVRALGRNVINPAEFGLPENTPWPDCMRVAVRAVSYCSEMLLLPGWESSEDATKEAQLAETFGMRVCVLTLDAITWTLKPEHGGLPLSLIVPTLTTLMQAQLAAGQAVELCNHSFFPLDDGGWMWGTNPYGQDFLIAQSDQEWPDALPDFVKDLLQGECHGLCPPEEYARAEARHAAPVPDLTHP